MWTRRGTVLIATILVSSVVGEMMPISGLARIQIAWMMAKVMTSHSYQLEMPYVWQRPPSPFPLWIRMALAVMSLFPCWMLKVSRIWLNVILFPTYCASTTWEK